MDVVTEAFHDGVYYLTLNRPEKKNAMSEELMEELYRSLQKAEREAAPIVVVRGAKKNFCSGGDVIEFRDSAEPGIKIDAMADFLNRAISLIRTMPAIVVAVVEGLAVGAGLSLSLACDFTLAEEKAVMNMGYRRIGLTPDGGGSIFLSPPRRHEAVQRTLFSLQEHRHGGGTGDGSRQFRGQRGGDRCETGRLHRGVEDHAPWDDPKDEGIGEPLPPRWIGVPSGQREVVRVAVFGGTRIPGETHEALQKGISPMTAVRGYALWCDPPGREEGI